MAAPTPHDLEQVLFDAVERAPDSEVVDRPGWAQIRTPSSPHRLHNVVIRAVIPAAQVSGEVARVVDDHRQRGAKMRWVIGPSSSPETLARAVVDAGLAPLGDTLAMWRPVPDEALPMDVPGLRVSEVTEEADVSGYARLAARAWNRGADFASGLAVTMRKALSGELPTRTWLAHLDGEPVAAATLRLLPGVGYLQGAAVLPAHRGRGVYRALLHHRLAVLRHLGVDRAVVWADADTSAHACAKVGFQTVCRADFFEG